MAMLDLQDIIEVIKIRIFARLNELENGDIITYKTNFFYKKV